MAKRKPKPPARPDVETYINQYRQYVRDLEDYIKAQMLLLEECKKYISDYIAKHPVKGEEE